MKSLNISELKVNCGVKSTNILIQYMPGLYKEAGNAFFLDVLVTTDVDYADLTLACTHLGFSTSKDPIPQRVGVAVCQICLIIDLGGLPPRIFRTDV